MTLQQSIVTLILSCHVIAACASVKVAKLSSEVRRPTAGDVDVSFTTAAISRPYKEIALITVDDEGWGLDETALIQKLIEKTKEVGADA